MVPHSVCEGIFLIYIHLHIRLYTHIYVCMCVRVCVYVCVCLCVWFAYPFLLLLERTFPRSVILSIKYLRHPKPSSSICFTRCRSFFFSLSVHFIFNTVYLFATNPFVFAIHHFLNHLFSFLFLLPLFLPPTSLCLSVCLSVCLSLSLSHSLSLYMFICLPVSITRVYLFSVNKIFLIEPRFLFTLSKIHTTLQVSVYPSLCICLNF